VCLVVITVANSDNKKS